MLERKLLTLVCVLGILVCGACFGPTRYTPPPPPAIEVEGIGRVLVQVTGLTDSHRLNSAALAAAMVERFNIGGANTHVNAFLENGPHSPQDAVLEVRIASETVDLQGAPGKDGLVSWRFNIRAWEMLIGKNGQKVWMGKEITHAITLTSYAQDEDGVWKDPSMQSAIIHGLANRLVFLATQQPEAFSATQETVPLLQ